MKWSTVLPTGSIGMRVTADQVSPSVEVEKTTSLERQLRRKRQSCQATYTLPVASTSAEGSTYLPPRRPPATTWRRIGVTCTIADQLAPPSPEPNTSREFWLQPPVIGTTTVPLGCTTSWPPVALAVLAGVLTGPQVRPPSLEVLSCTCWLHAPTKSVHCA